MAEALEIRGLEGSRWLQLQPPDMNGVGSVSPDNSSLVAKSYPVKGDVKKKDLPGHRRTRKFSCIQPPPRYVRLVVLTVLAFRVATSRHASSIPAVSSLRLRRRPWFPETGKRGGCRVGNHGPIGDSWPIAFLGYPRGHRVFIETRCRWHTGPNYAMDALPRTRASQEPIGHRRR